MAERLHSRSQSASSYLSGSLMWKLLCGASAVERYLGYLTVAAIDLLTGKPEDNEGQWKECPWPEARGPLKGNGQSGTNRKLKKEQR